MIRRALWVMPLSMVLWVCVSASAQVASVPCLAEPCLSPDGSEIAFVSAGDIWTVSAAGGEARLLVANPAYDHRPLYSPDGKRMAFISNRSGSSDIHVLTLETGVVRRLTFNDGDERLDAWSRDGKYIFFSSASGDVSFTASDIYRISADGGTPVPLAREPYVNEFYSAPHPDGKRLAYCSGGMTDRSWYRNGFSFGDTCDIYMVDKPLEPRPVVQKLTAGAARNLWPMFAQDGRMFFVSDVKTALNLYVRTPSGEIQQLTHFTNGRLHWPSISHNGKAIVFERDNGLWIFNTVANDLSPVPVKLRGVSQSAAVEHHSYVGGFDELALSPDGKKIAIVVHGEVFAASARDGGEAVRITRTTAIESHVTWSRNSRGLAYVSNRDDGKRRIFLYDFTTGEEFRLTQGQHDTRPRFSPDGRTLFYQADAKTIRALDLVTRKERAVVENQSFDRWPFDGLNGAPVFSPTGDYLAFVAPGVRGFENVHLVPTSGVNPATPQQITFFPNAGSNAMSWSPDGRFILFGTGQRTENYQLARIDLVPVLPRFKEDQFKDLFRSPLRRFDSELNSDTRPEDAAEGDQNAPTTTPATRPPQTRTSSFTMPVPQPSTQPSTQASTSPSTSPTTQPTRIVFENIRRRTSLLNLGFDVDFNAISPDGKTVLIMGTSAGQQNLYTIALDDPALQAVPRQITSTASYKSFAQFSPDGREVFFLDAGKVSAVSLDTRLTRIINVTAEMDTHFDADKFQVFNQAWTYVRDHFADASHFGVDWQAIRERYLPRAAGARTAEEFRRTMLLMLGELNASHLGLSITAARSSVGRIGVKFDWAEYEKTGRFRIASILPLSPGDLAELKVGEFIVGVDRRVLFPQSNFDELLLRKIGKRVVLRVSADGQAKTSREVPVQPIDTGTERNLAYRAWVEQRRAIVDRLSGGRLGYIHLADMSESALSRLNSDLDSEIHSRQGVVIDVRNNRGGFVNGYAIDVFARKNYLTMHRRGFLPVPSRVRLGQRSLDLPTTLITNRNTYSDGEDFTEAYRALKLGSVVGEKTAGCVIFTSQVALLDGTRLGLPHTHVMDAAGQTLEHHPRPVDIEVAAPPGETYLDKDAQLERAVEELLRKLKNIDAR